MKKTVIIIGILLLIVMIFISSCQTKEDSLIPSTGQTGVVDNDNSGALNSDSNDSITLVKEFDIESFTETVDGNFVPKFSLKNIEVNEGDKVRIIVNATNGEHNFIIDEYNISVETPINEETVIEFDADKAGTFEYYCSKPGHRAMGQWGTLTVNPKNNL